MTITLRTISIGYHRKMTDGNYGSRENTQHLVFDVGLGDGEIEPDETGISPAIRSIATAAAICHQIANARQTLIERGAFRDTEEPEKLLEKVSAQWAIRHAEATATNAALPADSGIVIEDEGGKFLVDVGGQKISEIKFKGYTREDAEKDLRSEADEGIDIN